MRECRNTKPNGWNIGGNGRANARAYRPSNDAQDEACRVGSNKFVTAHQLGESSCPCRIQNSCQCHEQAEDDARKTSSIPVVLLRENGDPNFYLLLRLDDLRTVAGKVAVIGEKP